MNKYLVKLYSRVNNETSAWIAFLVDTSMTAKQLKTFYECKSLSISEVEVLEVL